MFLNHNYYFVIRSHTGERPYKCPHCSYSTLHIDRFDRHMKSHANRGTDNFSQRKTSNDANSSPLGEEPQKPTKENMTAGAMYSCNLCRFSSDSIRNLTRHVNGTHKGK